MGTISRAAFASAVLTASWTLSACVNLAPAYQRPDAPVAAAWPAAAPASAGARDAGDIAWRDFVIDDRLRRVMEMALANSRDLRIAVLDVDNARARYRIQDATRLPGLDASAGLTRSGAHGVASNATSLGVALSGYEIDLFGRVRNTTDAALQSYLGTAEGLRAARITLVAAVATQWLALGADAETQRLNERTLALDERSLGLNQRMHELGATRGLPVVQAQAAVEATRGTLAAGRTRLQQDRDALALLVGREVPEDLLPLQALPAESAVLVDVPAGLPSRVLQQRPDVLSAEHSLQAAQLNIGVARAAYFPAITLTGSAGTASVGLAGLFKGSNGSWSFGPSISLPIFDGGARDAQLDSVKVQRDIALATYEKAIQAAFGEVADALAVRATLADRVAAQRAQVQASETALHYAEALFRNGGSSYLEVLDAQRSFYSAQQAGITLALAEQQNRIGLYKALGGGWKESN